MKNTIGMYIVTGLLMVGCSQGGGSSAPTGVVQQPEVIPPQVDDEVKLVSQLKCASGTANRLPGYNNYNSSLWKYEVYMYSDGSKVLKCLAFLSDIETYIEPHMVSGWDQYVGLTDTCELSNTTYEDVGGVILVNIHIWPNIWSFGIKDGMGKIKGKATGKWDDPKLIVGHLDMAPIININENDPVEDPELGHCFFETL